MLRWFRKKKPESELSKTSAQSGESSALEPSVAIEEQDPALPLTPTPTPTPTPPKQGLLARLRDRLTKTQSNLTERIRSAIGLKGKVDEELLEEIEDILIQGDVGAKAAARIIAHLREEGRRLEAKDAEALTSVVKDSIAEILSAGQRVLAVNSSPPMIILVVGVNGTGKTTTIGKLALQLTRAGKSVVLVAADTFRAAAVEQLDLWSKRSGAGFVSKEEGADPASVCFDALTAAKADPPDVMLIDTAGRLHTKTFLMNELGKVIRVIDKVYPGAPHETILVLDATTGQNALNQVTTFREVASLTGLVMTKLDGTAKGGILIAIKNAHPDLPIMKIGIGEAPEDLRDFDPREFADALFAEGK